MSRESEENKDEKQDTTTLNKATNSTTVLPNVQEEEGFCLPDSHPLENHLSDYRKSVKKVCQWAICWMLA